MEKLIIAITTYNLEKYISKTLESILNQKTNFNYKIYIADDASTDNTISILNDYKRRYPEIIELFLSKDNLGSLKNSNRLLKNIESEYFSFLDGDDYWTDKNRLQKQIDFMDNNKEYTICGGNTKMFYENNKKEKKLIKEELLDKTYDFIDFLNDDVPFVHTSSIVFRNIIFNNHFPEEYETKINTFEECALRGEDFRRIIHLEKGKMYLFKDCFSVYRIHSKGLWQSKTKINRSIESTISWNFYRKYFKEYKEYFDKKTLESYKDLTISLLMNNNFLYSFNLKNEDSYLYLELLKDLSNTKLVHHKNKKNILMKIKCLIVNYSLKLIKRFS